MKASLSLLLATCLLGVPVSACGSEGTHDPVDGMMVSDPPPGLTVRSKMLNGLLCYEVATRSGVAVDENCPDADLAANQFFFGQRSNYESGQFVVVWMRSDVTIASSESPFERTTDGWTLFEAPDSDYVRFGVEIPPDEFDCAVGTAVSCVPK